VRDVAAERARGLAASTEHAEQLVAGALGDRALGEEEALDLKVGLEAAQQLVLVDGVGGAPRASVGVKEGDEAAAWTEGVGDGAYVVAAAGRLDRAEAGVLEDEIKGGRAAAEVEEVADLEVDVEVRLVASEQGAGVCDRGGGEVDGGDLRA
jgi:hypothetical protein